MTPFKVVRERWLACALTCLAPLPFITPIALAASPAPSQQTAFSLDAAMAAAETDNIDVIRSRLALKTAQANLRIADTAPNPNLNLSAVQLRPGRIGRRPLDSVADTVVGIDLPLERGGKRQARTGEARALIDAAEGDLASARRDMREAVYGAYFDLKAAEQRSAILSAIAASYADSQHMAHTQEHAGSISRGDLSRQAVEASRAKTDAQQAAIALQVARLGLATLIGRERDAPDIATSGDWGDAPAAASTEPADLLALRRPDVLAAQSRVEAARRSLDGAHALRHPDVTVSMQYEHAMDDLGVGSSVGVGVSVPLPVRNRYSGEVDAAGTALVQAEAEARKAAAVATAEITIARQSLSQASERRREIEERQLPAARDAAGVAEFAYTNGATSLLELLDARRSLRTVELGAVDARADEAHAIAQLQAAETTGETTGDDR
ncbi:TolC family protein [Novosphingobium resinovorum]|uniref:TolC family protein n=1 Tax=Novosphingobium TaxID=165696 RepID=UPI001B3C5141|nr:MULTISPECIES: TolC family protein [Novosphingobium]MBF7010346.1 TolC family protein [Novosphingobium sp. HR1a]WJM28351.1 TolC family protein [Novosphingobium resinovorum]